MCLRCGRLIVTKLDFEPKSIVTYQEGTVPLGGAVAFTGLWLVRSTTKQAVWVRALAGDIVLCSWARHFTLTVPLSTQVYNWVPAKLFSLS